MCIGTDRLTDPYGLPELDEQMTVIEYKRLLVEQHELWKQGRTIINSSERSADSRALEIELRLTELWSKLSKENQEYMFRISEMLLTEVLGPSKEAQARQAEKEKEDAPFEDS